MLKLILRGLVGAGGATGSGVFGKHVGQVFGSCASLYKHGYLCLALLVVLRHGHFATNTLMCFMSGVIAAQQPQTASTPTLPADGVHLASGIAHALSLLRHQKLLLSFLLLHSAKRCSWQCCSC
jgi:hypothetical protein